MRSSRHTIGSSLAKLALALPCALVVACAGTVMPAEAPRLRCESGLEFTARFADDTAVIDGSRGREVLYRDAGGVGEQTVYSNPRMRAEFGLGATGHDAILRYLLQPLVLHCVLE